MAVPYIDFQGRRFQVVHYDGDLWRADRAPRQVGSLASEDYVGAEIKYFTTDRAELSAYTFRGMPHAKQWRPSRPLVLINMFHAPTRQAVHDFFAGRGNAARVTALKTAFPVNSKGNVYRVSTEETMDQDDAFLSGLCGSLTFADGYYMPAQEAREGGVGSFHSEIGLCQRALRVLTLVFTARNGPPPAPNRNRGTQRNRPNRNNNNNNNGNRRRGTGRNRSPLRFNEGFAVRSSLFNAPAASTSAAPLSGVKRGRLFNNMPLSPPPKRRFAPLSFNNANAGNNGVVA